MFTFNGFLAKLKTKFSTNKTPTNNHRFPLVLADGTPDGNATQADIMQLLVVASVKKVDSGTLTDCNEIGIYSIQYNNSSDISDLPCIGHAYMLVMSYGNGASATKTQFYISMTQRAFIRVKTGMGWQLWKEITLTAVAQ